MSYDAGEALEKVRVRNADESGTTDAAMPWIEEVVTRDSFGRIVSVTRDIDPGSVATSHMQYDASGRPVELTEPSGAKASFTYDRSGRLLTAVQAFRLPGLR